MTTNKSSVPKDLIKTYLETDYLVYDSPNPTLILKIGKINQALALVHDEHNVQTSVFISASNPFGKILEESENLERHRSLINYAQAESLMFVGGFGKNPQTDFSGEQSLLILGIDEERSRKIGKIFQQNAIVWIGKNLTPELIILR